MTFQSTAPEVKLDTAAEISALFKSEDEDEKEDLEEYGDHLFFIKGRLYLTRVWQRKKDEVYLMLSHADEDVTWPRSQQRPDHNEGFSSGNVLYDLGYVGSIINELHACIDLLHVGEGSPPSIDFACVLGF